MTFEFEQEALAGETVSRNAVTGRSGPGKIAVLVMVSAGVGLSVLTYQYFKPGSNAPKNIKQEFRTPQDMPNLSFSAPAAEAQSNDLVFAPPAVTPEPAKVPEVVAPPIIPYDDSAARAAAEAERLRLEAEARKRARLQSDMLMVSGNAGQSGRLGADQSTIINPPLEADTDANARFVKATAAQDVERVQATKNLRIDALIPQGTMIRGVLETAIQSDLPGMVRAMVSTDVWSFDGRRILLPKGTMLTGEYKSGIARGQTRILIVWTRALRADGTSVSLGSYGTDDLGRSGLSGMVDKHYLERFGASAVLSLVGGISSFIAGLNTDGTSNAATGATGTSIAQNGATQAQQTISQTMSDMANQALRDSINIPPTIHVDQGKQIIVFVRRDLDFSALYTDPVKEALHELRRRK